MRFYNKNSRKDVKNNLPFTHAKIFEWSAIFCEIFAKNSSKSKFLFLTMDTLPAWINSTKMFTRRKQNFLRQRFLISLFMDEKTSNFTFFRGNLVKNCIFCALILHYYMNFQEPKLQKCDLCAKRNLYTPGFSKHENNALFRECKILMSSNRRAQWRCFLGVWIVVTLGQKGWS